MSSVAGTYARAFADVVFDGHLDPQATLREVRSLADLTADNGQLRVVWETPAIPAEQKRGLLDAIAGRQKISRPVRNFMAVLIDHRRVHFLGPIVKQFEEELNRRLGFAEAEIISARELTAAERRAVEAQAEKLTGKKVIAHYSQDKAILGGAILRVGSMIYDGSVKGKLERIKEQLSSI
jgi:F-type H+-transporting ATPase subunit delta